MRWGLRSVSDWIKRVLRTFLRRRIFVSYSSDDREHATTFRKTHRVLGDYVWIDFEDIPTGADWEKAILKALKRCDAFILIWSKKASKSDWVKREIEVALDANKEVCPIVIDGYPLPENLRHIQSASLTLISASDELEKRLPSGQLDATRVLTSVATLPAFIVGVTYFVMDWANELATNQLDRIIRALYNLIP